MKRQVLAEHLAYLNKRLNEVPQFGAYAINSGQKRAFSAFGRLARNIARIALCTEKVDLSQYLPGFAELLDPDDGWPPRHLIRKIHFQKSPHPRRHWVKYLSTLKKWVNSKV